MLTLSSIGRLAFTTVLVVTAAALFAVAAWVWRRGRADAYAELARPYTVVTACFGIAALAAAVSAQLDVTDYRGSIVTLYLVIVPWTIFALRYAGYGTYVTRRRVVAAASFSAAVFAASLLIVTQPFGTIPMSTLRVLGLVQSVFVLALITLGIGASALVAVATYRHGRLSVPSALVAVWPLAHTLAVGQVTRPSAPNVNAAMSVSLFVGVVAALAVGVTRFDLVDYPAGVNTVGERAVFGDTAAPVFVLDTDGKVVRTNQSAKVTFDAPETLSDVTNCGVTDLVRRDTVGCWTDNGRRQFDPRVTPLQTDGGATLGHAVTFVDVTAREIRRQRISVLNRVLRHNVRNQLDVIRAHAEEAGAEPAVEGVDRLDRLAGEIRRVERLLDREGSGTRRTPLASFLRETVGTVTDGVVADTTVVAPDETVTVDIDLCEYVLRNLVQNAVEHGGETPRVSVRGRLTDEGVRIVVSDDGPGIPEAERAVIEAGEETPLSHATSVSLWGIRWAVGAMNGSLSFADSDIGGTEVTVVVPESQETVEGVESVADDDSLDGDDTEPDETAADDTTAAETANDDGTTGERQRGAADGGTDETAEASHNS